MLKALSDKTRLNWGLLLFLVLVLDVKLAIKIPVLIAACVWQLKRGRPKDAGVPPFYAVMIGIVLLDWFLFKGLKDVNYDLVAVNALFGWIYCIVAARQVRQFVAVGETDVIHRTLVVFFALNALVSLADLIKIIWETGAINPYLYQGMYQKYFIRTGDYIKGISFDTSNTNAVINAFGVVYFLQKKQGWMMLICMACLLATGSNFTNLLLLAVFVGLFVFQSDRTQKGGILLCMLMGAFFLGKVSPQNSHYTEETLLGKAAQTKSAVTDSTEIKRKAYAQFYMDSIRLSIWMREKAAAPQPKTVWQPKPVIPKPDINQGEYLRRDDDTTEDQRRLYRFVDQHREDLPLSGHLPVSIEGRLAAPTPGKVTAFRQVISFLRAHPDKALTGDGAGNFSSKLAFRSTGLGIMGRYPAKYAYVSPDFLSNHLDIYLDFFGRPKQMHSLTNSPDSVYGQLLGEYGIVGVGAFLLFYAGFFARRLKRGGYGIPLLVLLLGSFFIGYWFEQLSIVILFELLLFTETKTEIAE